ncbi:MAG: glycosyltransferase family 2 protein [Candidatus Omnitrophica bacterium]|nr:glycosyltransferase family 2 protein [Candidatus Omnitrophota bacterium]
MLDLSIVIPVKDEENNIEELIRRISDSVKKMGLTYEVIFVTDINEDNTLNLLKTFNKKDPRIKIVKLSNMFGHHHVAVFAGLNFTKANAVVVMDGDLQDCPEDIDILYKKMVEGYDVVFGVKERKNDSSARNLLSKSFLRLLNLLSDYKLEYDTSMFRIISRKAVGEILKFKETEPSFTGIISLIGLPTTKVMVTSGKRKEGKTKYGFFRQLNFALSFLLSFSIKPLRISSVLGFIISSLSFIYLINVAIQKLLFNKVMVMGWSTIVSLITFIGGIQLLFLGIIGEYVGRIFIETKRRPIYIIEEKIGITD